jgi:hypothetical protein
MKTRLMVIPMLAILLTLSMTSVAYAGSSLNSSNQWKIYEQNTLPDGNLHFYPADHGATFAMPDATSASPTFVNYMLDTYTASLTESNTITATFSVVTSSPTTVFYGNPDGGNPAVSFVRLFIQANLPEDGSATCGVGHKNLYNYWWADVGSYTFVPGSATATMSVTLNPANWSGICGNPGSANPAMFDTALANIKYVGLSFGSYYFFSNGLGVDGNTGTATFQLVSYSIS